MSWRVGKSLDVLLAQINALSPNRDKSSDGAIGNAEHASRSSDHNPWVMDGGIGVVTARDFTNDPAHGIVSENIAEALRAARDPRIKYIISNRKIAASYSTDGKPAWAWRPYSGTNQHDHHCHVSVMADKAHYDSTAPWTLNITPSVQHVETAPATSADPILRKGMSDTDTHGPVHTLQTLLNAKGSRLKIDGGFGSATEIAVRDFQTNSALVSDGVVGGYTWKKLRGQSNV